MADQRVRVATNPGQWRTDLIIDDDQPDVWHLETSQRVDHIIDDNQRLQEQWNQAGQDMKLVARIPVKEYARLEKEGIAHDPDAMKAYLNDPLYKKLRVYLGRV